IPPDVKEKMFNPFFTTKPAGEGTGLGLSISHDIIVKQHGGAIYVETKPGEVTQVCIIFSPHAAAPSKSRASSSTFSFFLSMMRQMLKCCSASSFGTICAPAALSWSLPDPAKRRFSVWLMLPTYLLS